MTTDGKLTTYDLGSADTFLTMLTGPDGSLWLYDSTKNSIVKFSIANGTITGTYAIPTPAGEFLGYAYNFVIGTDGNLWFTHANSVDRIKMDGTITEYTVPTANANPTALSLGADGNLWFAEFTSKKLGQLIISSATSSGQATINESDAILGNGATQLVPIHGILGGKTSGQDGKTSDNDVTADPCVDHTWIGSYTLLDVVHYISITTPAQKCADIKADALVVVPGAGGRGSLTFQMSCRVSNRGPSDATNVEFHCHVSGGISSQNSKLYCAAGGTVTPLGDGANILVPSLASGDDCVYVAPFVADPEYASFLVSAFGLADQIDPDLANNNSLSWFDPRKGFGGIVGEPKPSPVLNPIARGSNH
jgi:hypothetical protein